MKTVIIGHPCLDIIHLNNEEKLSYGGIIYSLIGFLIVAESEDIFYPVFQIDEKHYENYFKVIKHHAQINLDFVEKNQLPMNVVHLFFDNQNLSFECYQSVARKINIEVFIDSLPGDANFYINMISGFEIAIDDLKQIRKNFSGKIYFDFHTLTRGITEDGKRVYRPIENWKEWVSNCDVIQLNEVECENLTPEKLSEEEFAFAALEAGASVVNITKGSSGATSYYYNQEKLQSISYEPEKGLKFKSNVGCGDIFGAVFAYNYFRNESIETSLKEAVRISSNRIEVESVENIIDYFKTK